MYFYGRVHNMHVIQGMVDAVRPCERGRRGAHLGHRGMHDLQYIDRARESCVVRHICARETDSSSTFQERCNDICNLSGSGVFCDIVYRTIINVCYPLSR